MSIDFSPNRILNRLDFKSDEDLIDRIKFLNENEAAYREYINQPIFINNQFTEYFEEERLRSFFERIFSGLKVTKSKGIKKQVGILLRNIKKWEYRVKYKIGFSERIWY